MLKESNLEISNLEVSNIEPINSKMKVLYILIYSIVAICSLYIVDQVLELSYIGRTFSKLILFGLGPAVYIYKSNYNYIIDSIKNIRNIKNIKTSLILGGSIFVLIIVAYLLIKNHIDIDVLVNELENKYKINKSNLIYYGLYIIFVNSLLEELFFRGFIFMNLKRLNLKKWGNEISAIFFTIYHIAIFQNWFSWQVFLFVCFGLYIGGRIFNFLDDKPNTLFNSWFVHICADISIILIGFSIF